MNFLITPAYAQAAGIPAGTDFVMQMAPFAIILVIMYFLILRPQQKRAKAHADMIANVRVRVIRGMITDVRSKGEPVKD